MGMSRSALKVGGGSECDSSISKVSASVVSFVGREDSTDATRRNAAVC